MVRRKFLLTIGACSLALCLTNSLPAQEKKPGNWAALNEKEAGADFQIQGEYAGELPGKDGNLKWGVQVIARGDGKFHAVAYPGGLPGDGWEGKEKIETDGQLSGNTVRFSDPEKGSGEISGGKMTIFNKDNEKIGELTKVLRKSPTEGKKAPEGAVVLFDGKSPDAFKNGRVTEDGLLMQGIMSKQTFQSFSLHLEFQLSFMPYASGQGRANSGCYMQGRYETQILDSFGLKGEHNECGGIYTVKNPSVNMCFPPLSWQTYDVEYTAPKYDKDGKKTENARITLLHNGVKVQDNVEVPKGTTAHPTPEGPEPGPIYIQDHGNPIRFRNIWIVPKS